MRPLIDSVNNAIDAIKGQLALEAHGECTPQDVMAQVGQRILALTSAV